MERGKYWINGIQAGVQRCDLTIYKGGAQANPAEARSLIPIQPGTGEESLPQWGLTTWGDLLSPDGTIATAIMGLDIILPTRADPLMVYPPTLRQGQFWYHQGESTEQKNSG